MRFVVFKPARLAGLSAALLVLLGPLAPLAAPALAGTTGGARSAAAAGGTAATSTTQASGAPAQSGSTSGGAAPAAASPGKPTLATWFGPGFYGHATACGQRMSPRLVGVASRTLPCGTLVRVGYRGRLLTVPVLDRGPYGHSGAVWDLTAGAARALKIKDTVRITTEIVGNVANSPTLGEPPAGSPLSAAPPAGPAAPPPSAAAAKTGGASAG